MGVSATVTPRVQRPQFYRSTATKDWLYKTLATPMGQVGPAPTAQLRTALLLWKHSVCLVRVAWLHSMQ